LDDGNILEEASLDVFGVQNFQNHGFPWFPEGSEEEESPQHSLLHFCGDGGEECREGSERHILQFPGLNCPNSTGR